MLLKHSSFWSVMLAFLFYKVCAVTEFWLFQKWRTAESWCTKQQQKRSDQKYSDLRNRFGIFGSSIEQVVLQVTLEVSMEKKNPNPLKQQQKTSGSDRVIFTCF